jgi:hypothetical protein
LIEQIEETELIGIRDGLKWPRPRLVEYVVYNFIQNARKMQRKTALMKQRRLSELFE